MDTRRSPLGPEAKYENFGNLPQEQFSPGDSRLIREELEDDGAINVYVVGTGKIAVIFRQFNEDGGYTCYRWLLNVDGGIAGFCHTLRDGEQPKVEVGSVLKRIGLEKIQEELKRIWGISMNIRNAVGDTLLQEQITSKQRQCDIICERRDLTAHSVALLHKALDRVGVKEWHTPKVRVVFQPATALQGLAQVNVRSEGIEIAFDDRFRDAESEQRFMQELRRSGIDFPGVEQTLRHELGHIALWSVTEMDRQPATRLVDEGWASLIENAGSVEAMDSLTEKTKEEVRKGLETEPAAYERCLDFQRAVSNEEGLNAAEYAVGRALLLWIRETYGVQALIDLLRQSISSTRRNKEREDNEEFEPAAVDANIHGHEAFDSYAQLIASSVQLAPDVLQQKAAQWEGEQLGRALLRVTGLRSAEEVQAAFRQWLTR